MYYYVNFDSCELGKSGNSSASISKMLYSGFEYLPFNLNEIVAPMFKKANSTIKVSAETIEEIKRIKEETNKVIDEINVMKQEMLAEISVDNLNNLLLADKKMADESILDRYKDIDATEPRVLKGESKDLRVVYYKHTTKSGNLTYKKGLMIEHNIAGKTITVISANGSETTKRSPRKSVISLDSVININPVKNAIKADLLALVNDLVA